MSFYYPPFNGALEPSQGSVRSWLDNLYSKFQPIESSRWREANIDTQFYANAHAYINSTYGSNSLGNSPSYYFNLCQQPVNMITGYQRQHRKQIIYQAADGADPKTTDQYTRLIKNACQKSGIDEVFSKACEQSAITGMVLLQPYLDFTGDDPAQGQLKVKLWEYNSFLIDPYAREADLSDAQFVWCQEYISKQEAEDRFPDKTKFITPMAGTPQRYGSFYFLPENYNMARNDLLVLSYVWYKWKRKKKMLYSQKLNQFFDFVPNDENLEEILYHIPDMEEVTVDTSTWKLAVVLNDQLMFQGDNPLGGDECPFIMVPWNYEPHQQYYDLRSRGLVRTMRDPQALFNYKVIQNNDIAAATINVGWKRKIGAVANEDNLKKSGQGWDVIINEGYELADVEKIIPSAVPESDLALAQQMQELIFSVSGINMENWSGQNDKQISSLTMLMKQAANLMVFQKYFDQWDLALKLLGERLLQIAQYNFSGEKVMLMIGEEPTQMFYSRIFAKYKTVVEEGLLTPTQKNLQAHQLLEINQTFGREVIPPSMIIKDMNIQGKSEVMAYLQQQEESAAHMQQEQAAVEHAFEQAKLQELMSKAANNIAMAKERYGRFESNVGLLEERLSEVSKNHSLSLKAKMEAIEKLMLVASMYGDMEVKAKAGQLQGLQSSEQSEEQEAQRQASSDAVANELMSKLMNGMGGEEQPQEQPMQSMEQGQQQEQMPMQ